MNVSLSRWELQTLQVQLREEISFKRKVLCTLNLSYDDRLSTISDIDRLITLKEKIDNTLKKRDENLRVEDYIKYTKRLRRIKK